MEEEETRSGAPSRQSGHSNAPQGVPLQSLFKPDNMHSLARFERVLLVSNHATQNQRLFAGADMPKAAAAPQVPESPPCEGEAHENVSGK
jgi:hypothetical protein